MLVIGFDLWQEGEGKNSDMSVLKCLAKTVTWLLFSRFVVLYGFKIQFL
jgi:hypothetical protein